MRTIQTTSKHLSEFGALLMNLAGLEADEQMLRAAAALGILRTVIGNVPRHDYCSEHADELLNFIDAVENIVESSAICQLTELEGVRTTIRFNMAKTHLRRFLAPRMNAGCHYGDTMDAVPGVEDEDE